jgi:hypothetical protein
MRNWTALFILAAAVLATAVAAMAHSQGERERHHVNVTLSATRVRIDYDIVVMQPGHSHSMSDEAFKSFQTRGARRVGELMSLAINGKNIPLNPVHEEKSETREKYAFEARIETRAGVNDLSFLDMNLIYKAIGDITFRTEGDAQLPRTIQDETLAGEVNFQFGVGAKPPDQEVFIGSPGEAKSAPPHDHKRPVDKGGNPRSEHRGTDSSTTAWILGIVLALLAGVAIGYWSRRR